MNAARSIAPQQHEAAPSPAQREDDDRETFEFLHSHLRNLRRSIRRARETPRDGIEASIDLMMAAVENRLKS